MMQLIRIGSLVLIALISSQLSFAQNSPLSQLKVQGNQFVNERGEQVVLRGLNTSDPDHLPCSFDHQPSTYAC